MRKFLLVLTILSVILLGACEENSKDKSAYGIIKDFREAVVERDVDSFFDFVKAEKEIFWNKKNANDIINILNEDEYIFEDIINLLEAQAGFIETGEDVTGNPMAEYYPGEEIMEVGPLYIRTNGKKHDLFIREYEVVVEAEPGSKVDFQGEAFEVDSSGTHLFSGLGPGIYQISGGKQYNNELVSDAEEFFLFDEEDFKESIYLSLEEPLEDVYVSSGEAVYKQSCASCHGSDLSGGAGPGLENVGDYYSKEEIMDIIDNGTGSMPAQSLFHEDAATVAEWLITQDEYKY